MDLFEREILETLSTFEKDKVRYLIVGGFAVNYYGYHRTTADLDLWIDVSDANKMALIEALDHLGFDTEELNRVDLTKQPPIDIPIHNFKIELINYLGGAISFDEAYQKAQDFQLEGINIKVLHINHLIALKEVSHRPKDRMDVEELKKIRDKQ